MRACFEAYEVVGCTVERVGRKFWGDNWGRPDMGIFGRKMNGLDRIGAEVEGGIRELVSRDVAEPRRQIASSANDSESVINNLGLLLQRVSLNSVNEIDELIAELKMLREQLQHDGERMAREIVGYASLSQAAMQSTKILTDSLTSRSKNES